MEVKLRKIYRTDYNLVIAEGLWQTHHQILSVIFSTEFIKLHVYVNKHKNWDICQIEYKYSHCFLWRPLNKIQMLVLWKEL